MIPPLRIAVADDELDTRDYLKKVLERLGHIVLGPVENGAMLVDLCLEKLPDLVITDIRMPEMNGDEALRKIRAVHPIPCIVLSASGQSEVWRFGPSSADWTFLGKPFRTNDLQNAIGASIASPGRPGTSQRNRLPDIA